MVVGGFDITDNYIRARQIDPSEMEPDSMRTIRLTSGIKAITGRRKGEKTSSIQSILFDKKNFSEEKARSWLDKHKSKFMDALQLEEQKASLFSEELSWDEHLDGHLPPLTPSQIARLLEIAGPADEKKDKQNTPENDMHSEYSHSKFAKTV